MKLLNNIKEWWTGLNKKRVMSFRLFWGIVFLLLLIFLLIIDFLPGEEQLQPGEVSPADITAPYSATIVDEERTEQLRQEAAEAVDRLYEEDSAAAEEALQQIEELFAIINEERETFTILKDTDNEEENILPELTEGSEQSAKEFASWVRVEYGLEFEDEQLLVLLQMEETELQELESDIYNIMSDFQEDRILPEDLEDIRDELEAEALELEYDLEVRSVAGAILKTYLTPNMFLDEETTEERRQAARKAVEPYQQNIRQGEMIVRQGDIVTEDDIRIMEALGLQQPESNILNAAGLVVLVLVILLVIVFFLYKYKNEVWNDNKKLLFLELLVIVILLAARVIDVFEADYLYYLVPVAAASILTAVLINSSIAVVVTGFIALLMGLYFDYSFMAVLTGFCSGMVGVFSVSRISQRGDLVKAGINISGVMVVMVTANSLVQPGGSLVGTFRPIGLGVLNGLLVAILANGLLPYLESVFDLTSSVRLLELSNSSHPLLKRLHFEAPGTYHHSVMVCNLAETAADEIDADPLLTRVAAYYHDIGKLKRPYFFTDNQFGGDNPHDDISPNLSSLIIKSHVKDGVELARQYGLPEDVIDIIEQHHGKNLISYFYQQAREENNTHEKIKETDFSYDGPKPHSKEAAILMLADIVEAALRSKQFDKSDHNRIENVVHELIRDRLEKHQLDESNLTLKELKIIGDCFVRVLTGIYHQRVEYPDNLLEEHQKDDQNDDSKN